MRSSRIKDLATGYDRSSDGVEMMRLFVIANSILFFVTMGWPKMQEAISILKEYLYAEE